MSAGLISCIIIARFLLVLFNYESSFKKHPLLLGIGTDSFEQIIPTRRRVSQAELLGNFAANSAGLEIIHCILLVFVVTKLVLVELAGIFQYLDHLYGLGLSLTMCRCFILRYLQAYIFCECFNGWRKIQLVKVHDKSDSVAAGPTTETVVELSVGLYAEGRSLLLVKRTASSIIFACFFKSYSLVDNFYNICSI